jgi:hypothetical protein
MDFLCSLRLSPARARADDTLARDHRRGWAGELAGRAAAGQVT